MLKNVKTTSKLYSFHTLAKWCSKFSKLDFNSTWTKNSHKYKEDLEKAEEPEIKLPSFDSYKKQENSRNISISVSLTMIKLLSVCITTNYRKFFKMVRISDHLISLLRNLYAGQEATVRSRHGTTDCFQIRKGVRQGCILSPCLFNLHAENIMWNARLDKAQVGIKTAGRSINNLRYADDTTLMAESEEELKSLLMKWKRRVKKLD